MSASRTSHTVIRSSSTSSAAPSGRNGGSASRWSPRSAARGRRHRQLHAAAGSATPASLRSTSSGPAGRHRDRRPRPVRQPRRRPTARRRRPPDGSAAGSLAGLGWTRARSIFDRALAAADDELPAGPTRLAGSTGRHLCSPTSRPTRTRCATSRPGPAAARRRRCTPPPINATPTSRPARPGRSRREAGGPQRDPPRAQHPRLRLRGLALRPDGADAQGTTPDVQPCSGEARVRHRVGRRPGLTTGVRQWPSLRGRGITSMLRRPRRPAVARTRLICGCSFAVIGPGRRALPSILTGASPPIVTTGAARSAPAAARPRPHM